MGESSAESGPGEFDHYTTALLFGGPERVVQVAVLMLHEQRRIRISRATRRVEVVRREPAGPEREDDPVQAAVLGEIPRVGRPLGQVIAAVARSPEVRAIADAMRETGLMRGRRLRPTRDGRALRRMIAEERDASRPGRLAVLGPAGVEETRLREILEADDPEPLDLPHYRARSRWYTGTGGAYSGGSGLGGSGEGDFGGGDSGGGGGGGGGGD
ncbi:TIGR04222 domain-containing membrane protein [Actinomadura livida]|uniref:Putative membrane protein YgcG n=1 Tax=Actinomadura livida TaxID=79909 RepID=A0A7W7MXY2_9ACTN|nr:MULTISPECIES: TIGR04222 domain-containing membrane protein [Actinomadura]MBB4774245.1 putative membrane protein YgcG [Actinomadura catellatispora]GGT83938.1 hypothetical protein GCM10010208_03060 [Actinomadura livida]